MADKRVVECSSCGRKLDDDGAVSSAERQPCPTCGSKARTVKLEPMIATAHAKVYAPELRVDYVLDAVSLAHLGIVLSLMAAVGFGVAAESVSGWLGVGAAVLVGLGWAVVCKARAVRNPVVRLMRWLAAP